MSIITHSDPLNKWVTHKKMAEDMARKLAKMRTIASGRAARMLTCGDTLSTYRCQECGHIHIAAVQRCRDRLCPLCSWRLSIQRYHEMLDALELLRPRMDENHIKVCMLTLTVRNVKVRDLKECLRSMSGAWKRLYQAKIFKPVWGWARCTEITYNSLQRTCHPHMHILLLWDEKNMSIAETMKQLKEGWRAAARLDYTPIIDLREAYSKDGDDELIAAAGEAFAYSIKPATTGNMPLRHLEEFANAISGFRFISYGGAIKQARQELGFKDEDEEQEHQETVCTCGSQMEHMVLAWSAGGYHRLKKEGEAV